MPLGGPYHLGPGGSDGHGVSLRRLYRTRRVGIQQKWIENRQFCMRCARVKRLGGFRPRYWWVFDRLACIHLVDGPDVNGANAMRTAAVGSSPPGLMRCNGGWIFITRTHALQQRLDLHHRDSCAAMEVGSSPPGLMRCNGGWIFILHHRDSCAAMEVGSSSPGLMRCNGGWIFITRTHAHSPKGHPNFFPSLQTQYDFPPSPRGFSPSLQMQYSFLPSRPTHHCLFPNKAWSNTAWIGGDHGCSVGFGQREHRCGVYWP